MKTCLIFLLLAFPALGQNVLRDIPYIPNGSAAQRLDVYEPATPGPARPLVVYIHGGGWRGGSKSGCPATAMVNLGYTVASVEYRFSQEAIFPAQIEDCKAAIRFLRANAAQYQIDPNRVGVWGASAGGHLVALLGVTGSSGGFDVGGNTDQSSAVQCVVDFFGPADFLNYGGHPPSEMTDPKTPLALLVGGPISNHQPEARSASPITYVSPTAAPFLIMHGDKDPLVPLQQSQELNAALQKAGVESTLQVVPGAGHGGPGFSTPENQKLILAFFEKHLKAAAR